MNDLIYHAWIRYHFFFKPEKNKGQALSFRHGAF
jgi:hypothetical protein